MSMIRCDECGSLIDSDDEPECFVTTGGGRLDVVLCESCRGSLDEMEHERQERQCP